MNKIMNNEKWAKNEQWKTKKKWTMKSEQKMNNEKRKKMNNKKWTKIEQWKGTKINNNKWTKMNNKKWTEIIENVSPCSFSTKIILIKYFLRILKGAINVSVCNYISVKLQNDILKLYFAALLVENFLN